jgi:hypothetical protein
MGARMIAITSDQRRILTKGIRILKHRNIIKIRVPILMVRSTAMARRLLFPLPGLIFEGLIIVDFDKWKDNKFVDQIDPDYCIFT